MKQFKFIIIDVIFAWLILAGFSAVWINYNGYKYQDKYYMVEINRIQDIHKSKKVFSDIDLSNYKYIQHIDYFPVTGLENLSSDIEKYFNGQEIAALSIAAVPKECSYIIIPFINQDVLQGYVRYTYHIDRKRITAQFIIMDEAILCIIFLFVMGFVLYIWTKILKPLSEVNEIPYELSKGILKNNNKIAGCHYYSKFLWGLELLRLSLEEHKKKELKLEREKKLMILSISHDIRTPISTIKLYAKALYDNLYHEEEKKTETARKIEEKADQIERLMEDIVRTSSTELMEFEIKMDEFYLKDLINIVQKTFKNKLDLLKTELMIQPYTNKLLRGDMNKLLDVFDNIIQNAIKYGDGKKIIISFGDEDDCQLIRISNSGAPIAPINLHHMFEGFWRGENAIGKQGNGLGLYICKQIMLKMEGEIYAEIEENGMGIVVVLNKLN